MKEIRLGQLIQDYKRRYPDEAINDLDQLEPFADWMVMCEAEEVNGQRKLKVYFEPRDEMDDQK